MEPSTPGSTPTQTCHTPIGWRKSKRTKNSCEQVIKKIVNDGTGTEPYWIASLTDDYSAYVRAHTRTESWRAEGAHPGIRSLTWFNPGLNYMLIQCLLHVLKQIHLKTEYKSSALREVIFQCFQFVDLFLTAN